MDNHSNQQKKKSYGRKGFLMDSLKIAGGITLLSSTDFVTASTPGSTQKDYTVQGIIDIILKEVPGAPFKETVDTIKAGGPDLKVTGIITTMFATVNVINEAVKRNVNFIIAHEPTFYNHTDDKNWVKDNSIVMQKQSLLDKHSITVWRFHDYCHALKPDAVSYGVAKKAGWLPYFKPGETTLEIPGIKFDKLTQHLKQSLSISHVRIIGNPEQNCKRITLLPGAWGGQRQISTVVETKPDVLVVGESAEWETVEFVRDGRLLGSSTALIVLGHSVSEEPGMEWVADWLKPLLPGIKITHVASKDPFTWV